jgi:mannosyltransferase
VDGVREKTWAWPLAVGLLSAAVGLYDLGRRSFWIDEAFNIVLVRDGWPLFLRTIGGREPSQAVYLLFLKPYVALVGHGEVVTRLPSVLAGAFAAALLVVLGRRLFGLWVGVVAGLLLAVDGTFVEWSQYARTYSLAVLASVITTLVFVRACASPTRRRFLQYGLVGAVSIYTHFYAGFVLVAHAAAVLVRRPRFPLRLLGGAWAVIGVGLIPFAGYVVAGSRSPVEWIPPLDVHEVWSSLWFAAGENAALLVLAFVGAFFTLRARATRDDGALIVAWLAAPLVCGALVSLVKPALVPRFLIVASPAVALLAALAIARPARREIRVAATGLVVVFAIPGLVHTYTQNPEDWRAAAAAARAAVRDGSTVAVLPDFGWRALDVYAPDVPRVTHPTGRAVTVLVTGSSSSRRALVGAFIGHSPYGLARTERVGPDFVAERWVRR